MFLSSLGYKVALLQRQAYCRVPSLSVLDNVFSFPERVGIAELLQPRATSALAAAHEVADLYVVLY